MLAGTGDFHHFIPLWLTLTLPGGHEVSAKLGFVFSHTFQLIRVKFDVVSQQFNMNTLILLLSEI